MNWDPQQAAALSSVSEWHKSRSAPFFYLAGYAGTGKTTLARHFAEGVTGEVLYASFTGKAASVMRDKGCDAATTIHRLIYTSQQKGTRRLKELQEQLENAASDAEKHELRTKIREEIDTLRAPNFYLNPDSKVKDAALVIIDECSMVSTDMGRDLLSFGTPVLVLGDPAQLEPVGSAGFFTKGEPDMMLTEVHRQAQESGILRLATKVRRGEALVYCDLGDARVIAKGDLDPQTVPGYDQVLVGRNKTRRATNVRMRDLLGRTSPLPEEGDRLVCLRNNHDAGLLNGEIYVALEDADIKTDDKLGLCIQPEGGGGGMRVDAWQQPFLGEELMRFEHNNDTQEFDYGHVLTVHKAQGSQWRSVLVFDETRRMGGNPRKWLYTAITRASDKLTVIR